MRLTATTFPVVRCWAVHTVPKLPATKERKGKARKGKEREGKERKGKERRETTSRYWYLLSRSVVPTKHNAQSAKHNVHAKKRNAVGQTGNKLPCARRGHSLLFPCRRFVDRANGINTEKPKLLRSKMYSRSQAIKTKESARTSFLDFAFFKV